MSLPVIVKAEVNAPPVLLIPIIASVFAALKLTKPPSEFPNWLLIILIAFATAPVFEIAVKAPTAVRL